MLSGARQGISDMRKLESMKTYIAARREKNGISIFLACIPETLCGLFFRVVCSMLQLLIQHMRQSSSGLRIPVFDQKVARAKPSSYDMCKVV